VPKTSKKADTGEQPPRGEGKGEGVWQKLLWQISGSLRPAKKKINKRAKLQHFSLLQSF